MDSSSSGGGGSPGPDHSWLAFSLSNQAYHNQSSNNNPPTSQHLNQHHQHQHPLSLFQPPFASHHSPAGDVGGGNGGDANGQHHQNHHHHQDLSFLGSGDGGLLHVGLFPETPTDSGVTVANTSSSVYESPQMRSLAVSFFGGFPNDTRQQHQQQHEEVVVAVLGGHERENNNENLCDIVSSQQQLAIVPASTAVVTPVNSSNSSKKTVEGFGQRTSIYRGVTRHRWTGRYEAHLWDNSCRREGQSRKGRQVYLGGYDKEEKAARAYDLAALKYWGPTTTTNFPLSEYERELDEMKNMTRQEFVASLRRKSSGFSRGASIYRGVTRHHQHGRWQARIGRVAGNKDLYLGTFSTQEEAAEAYDIAAIKFRGLNAVTNFDISRYDVKSIMSSNLPVGGMSNKTKSLPDNSVSDEVKALEGIKSDSQELTLSSQEPSTASLNFAIPIKSDPTTQTYGWPALYPVGNNEALGYSYAGTGSVAEYMQQPIVTVSGDNNTDANEGYDGNLENGSNSSNWIVTPTLHSFQGPKPNLSVLQTPIFGIE